MKYIYKITDTIAIFRGIEFDNEEENTQLIIPDFYKGMPVGVVQIDSAMWSDIFVDIIVGNNVTAILNTSANIFGGINLQRIYLGKSLIDAAALTSSSAIIGKNVTDIYYHPDCNCVIPTENSAGNPIVHHKGVLGIKYQLVGDYINKTPLIPDGFATEEYVDDKLNDVAMAGGQVQADCLEEDETKASYIKNKPFYDTRKFEDIESNKVLARTASPELDYVGLSYIKRANLPDSPSVFVNEIKNVTGGMSGSFSNEWEPVGNASYRSGSVVLVDESDINADLIEGVTYNVSFSESGIYVLAENGHFDDYTTIKFKGEFKQIENKFLHIDKESIEDSNNPIASGEVYKINSEVQINKAEITKLKDMVSNGQSDYTENDATSMSHILNRPFYEEEVYENNIITIPTYTGTEICSTILKDVYVECKYVKIAELNHDAYTTLDHALKALKLDGAEIEINNSMERITNEDATILMDGYYVDLGTQILTAIETPLSNASVGGTYDFPESGLYIRVSREAQDDEQGNPDWDNAPDFAHEFSEIHFGNIIHKLDAKFLPEEFTNLENSVETVKTDIVNIKADNTAIKANIETIESDITELQNETNVISIEDFPTTANNNDIVALVSDIEAPFNKLNVEVKTREELSSTDENGITTVDLSGVTLVKNVKIGNLSKDDGIIDNTIWQPWRVIRRTNNGIKVGIGIYDKSWQNGLKILWSDVTYDGLPYVTLTKVADGVDGEAYYWILADSTDENGEPLVEDYGWYKLVDGSYVALTDEELSSVTQEFYEAYVVDYWAVESETAYNEAIDAGLVVQPPTAISDFISNFITTTVKQGFYKSVDSTWVRWDGGSLTNEKYIEKVEKLPTTSKENELVAFVKDEVFDWDNVEYTESLEDVKGVFNIRFSTIPETIDLTPIKGKNLASVIVFYNLTTNQQIMLATNGEYISIIFNQSGKGLLYFEAGYVFNPGGASEFTAPESGWYKGDTAFEKATKSDLEILNGIYTNIAVVDYGKLENEGSSIVDYSIDYIIDLLAKEIVVPIEKGFYVSENGQWIDFVETDIDVDNFATKEELNQLLDSFAALLDSANREVL